MIVLNIVQLGLFAAVYVDRQEMVLSIVDGIVDFDSGFFFPECQFTTNVCRHSRVGERVGAEARRAKRGRRRPPFKQPKRFLGPSVS